MSPAIVNSPLEHNDNVGMHLSGLYMFIYVPYYYTVLYMYGIVGIHDRLTSLFASMREKSRMSVIRLSRVSPEQRMVLTCMRACVTE